MSLDTSTIENRWASFRTRTCRFRNCNHTLRTQPPPWRFSREFTATLIIPRDSQKTSGASPIPGAKCKRYRYCLPSCSQPSNRRPAQPACHTRWPSVKAEGMNNIHPATTYSSLRLPIYRLRRRRTRPPGNRLSKSTGVSRDVKGFHGITHRWVSQLASLRRGSNANLPRLSKVFRTCRAQPTSADAFYDSTTSKATSVQL